jgi:hypothetical protein
MLKRASVMVKKGTWSLANVATRRVSERAYRIAEPVPAHSRFSGAAGPVDDKEKWA